MPKGKYSYKITPMNLKTGKSGKSYITSDKKGRRSKKASGTFGAINNYNNPISAFPRNLHTKVKYLDDHGFTLGALGISAEQVYRVTSIWDPDFTGGGSTVVGLPEMRNMYGKYMVTRARATLEFSNPSVDGIHVGYSLQQPGTVNGLGLIPIMENFRTYSKALNNTGTQVHTMKVDLKPWALIDLSKTIYDSDLDNHAAAINASPLASPVLRVFAVGDGTAATAAATVRCLVRIEYSVKFYSRLAMTSAQW